MRNMSRVVNIVIFLSRFCLITSGKGSGGSRTFFLGWCLGASVASDGNGWGSGGFSHKFLYLKDTQLSLYGSANHLCSNNFD